MKKLLKQYSLYLIRWQLSSPILAVFTWLITNNILSAIVANFIGGVVFFWVDRFIFKRKKLFILEFINRNAQVIGRITSPQYKILFESNDAYKIAVPIYSLPAETRCVILKTRKGTNSYSVEIKNSFTPYFIYASVPRI